MPNFVALLRGVNVGSGNRVPMSEFKRMLEGLGYAGVRTLLNSGNAVFASSSRSCSKHAAVIAEALQRDFGVSARVVVKSAAELTAIIEGNPIVPPESEHSRFLVAFAQEESALRALQSGVKLAGEREQFIVTSFAAYLHCPAGLLKSKLAETMLGRKTGHSVTTRNWSTVLKLGVLACEPSPAAVSSRAKKD